MRSVRSKQYRQKRQERFRRYLARSSGLVGLAALLAVLPTPAFAQSLQSPPADVSLSNSTEPDQAETGIGDIVVTATRREERLQDVPISVSAITNEALAASGVTDVREVMFVVPGFAGGRNFGVLQPVIRGVGSSGASPGDESNVALYVDGIYQPHANGNIVDFGAVDRVEVLRGPQGTLFGRNATGGLVNIITPDPKFNWEGRLSTQYGRFDGANSFGVRGYVTGPIAHNLAVNLGVLYSKSGDYIKDLVRGGELGDQRSLNVRGKILYEPSDRFQAILTLGYADQRGGNGNLVQPLNGNTQGNRAPGNIVPTRPNSVALSVEPRLEVRQRTAALRTKLDLGSVGLETSTGYLSDRVLQLSDTDGSPFIISQNQVVIHTRALSHEIRVLSQSEGKLKWIAGGYFYDMHARARTDALSGVPPFTQASPLLLQPRVKVFSLAGFGEATYSLTDDLNLTAGARYTTEERQFIQRLNTNLVVPPTNITQNSFTYRVTGQYFFAPKSNIYATYSTGFKSGVFNAYGLSATPTKPGTIKAIEIGVKADPLPWLRTNLAFFSYRYDDLQVTARQTDSLGGASYVLQNAAKAKVRGFDVEIQALVGQHLSLSASASVLDPTYDSFPNAQILTPVPGPLGFPLGNATSAGDVSGNDLVRAPRYTASFTADWTHDLAGGTLGLNGNVYLSDKVYFDFANRLVQPAYARLNAQVSWTTSDEKFKVRIYGTNLTNKLIIQQATALPVTDQVTYERPRELGIGLDIRF